MGRLLLLAFVVVPLLETFLLAQIGAAIGWANTIALVIATGIAGGLLARMEGARTWRRWREALAEGRVPDDGVVSGLLVLVGGALLITPGVVTDVVGLLLLLPASRRRIAAKLRAHFERSVERGASSVVIERPAVQVVMQRPGVRVVKVDLGSPMQPPREPASARQVIDADFEVRESE